MSKPIRNILLVFIALLVAYFLKTKEKKNISEDIATVASVPVATGTPDEQKIQAQPTPKVIVPTQIPSQPKYEPKPPTYSSSPNPVPNSNKQPVPPPAYYPYYPPPPPPPWPFVKNERRLSKKLRGSEIDEVMKSLRAKNLGPYIYGAPPFLPTPSSPNSAPSTSSSSGQPTALDHLLGKFEGEIRFDKESKVWQMYLELSGKTEDQKFMGSTTVELTENGKPINKAIQTGELSLTKKISDNSLAVLLTPFEAHHFQLYYLSEQDAFAGNYYARTAPNVYEPKGTVRLGRKLP